MLAWWLLVSVLITGQSLANIEHPLIGYKGPLTPRCADGTVYATSSSKCDYPKDAIQSWINRNGTYYKKLFNSVAVQTTIPEGAFPKAVNGKEMCDFVEDYPVIQWVYSPELGWMPVMQSKKFPQYFRLEACTGHSCNTACGGSSACATQCRTFHSRQRILVWNGKQPVSTVVLLPYACKCVIENRKLPGLAPKKPLFSEKCNPFIDCSCPCATYDSACVEFRIKNNLCRLPGTTHCNPYFDCHCPCASNDLNCINYRARNDPCVEHAALTCNPLTSCACPCPAGDFKCVAFRFESGFCAGDEERGSKDDTCNPYLSCECACVPEDYSCVSYRIEREICLDAEHVGKLEACDAYRNCHCPCPAGDWACARHRREKGICVEEDREFGFDERFYKRVESESDESHRDGRHRHRNERKSSDSDEHRRHKSDESSEHRRRHKSDETDRCKCDARRWGPWCDDPIWRCLNESDRLKKIG